MNLKAISMLLFLFITVMLAGCYTKLGYYDPGYLKEKQHKHVEKTDEEIEQASDSDVENPDESTGYYGRRKRTYDSSYSYADDSYWVPYYAPPQYAYYPPMYHYPHPWYYGYGHYGYYGYRAPYYNYYRSYSPYRGYYGGYRGSSFLPASRSTYKRGAVLNRSENRRSRSSRSVTSSNSRSDRPQRRTRIRNEN